MKPDANAAWHGRSHRGTTFVEPQGRQSHWEAFGGRHDCVQVMFVQSKQNVRHIHRARGG